MCESGVVSFLIVDKDCYAPSHLEKYEVEQTKKDKIVPLIF